MKNNFSVELNKQYWDSFYMENRKHTPSQFCVCVLTEINPNSVVVEFGCGNGRDAHYFASQAHITVAMDLSHQAIKCSKEEAKFRNTKHSTFFQGDLTSQVSVQKVVEFARENAKGEELVFYSRFVMHSLDTEQESRFLHVLTDCMKPNEVVCFEFRSVEDKVLNKHYGGHFRRYVDTDNFKRILTEDHGYVIVYSITGQGMAKFKEEDPFVSRVIAKKK